MKKFFLDLDGDIRESLIEQLRDLWTHTSTAIEGNTLTLGETAFVLNEGLTVSGKPLKDHEEVVGHAHAIELLYGMLEKEALSEEDLFILHKAVQTENVMDIHQPFGGWKVENNGTYVLKNGERKFINYVEPAKVPALMNKWLGLLNSHTGVLSKEEVLAVYAELHIAFVTIHPFADGNGRMARLLANLPVLRAGFPPIIISNGKRLDYITILSEYQFESSAPTNNDLVPGDMSDFKKFIKSEWSESLALVEDAYKEQEKRDEKTI